MPFRQFTGIVGGDGTSSIFIQQDNALVEWNIYQISVSGPNPATSLMTVSLTVNGFFLCSTPRGAADTAAGPPNVLLSRTDILAAQFAAGNPGDQVNVGIWYNENQAGVSNYG